MIQVYGADWCADCRRTKRQLEELGIAFVYLDVEHDDALRDRAVAVSGAQSIPVVCFPDGTHLVEPTNPDLRAKLVELGFVGP